MEDQKIYLVEFTYTDADGVERKAKDYFRPDELILIDDIDSGNIIGEGRNVEFKVNDCVQIDLNKSDSDDDRIMNCYDCGRGVIIQIYDKKRSIISKEGEYRFEKEHD